MSYMPSSAQPYMPTSAQPVDQQDKIPGIVKAGFPIVGGILGGTAGSVGGPVGSMAMGGLGAMGGQGLINLLEHLTGGPGPQNIQQNAESLRNAGAAQIVGEGAGSALRALTKFNPIGLLDNLVTNASKNSSAIIEKAPLMTKFTNEAIGGAAPGTIPEVTSAVNKVSAQMPQEVMNLNGYTMEQINALRKNLNKVYGDSNIMGGVQDILRRLVREAQVGADPNIGRNLAIEKYLGYDVPNAVTHLPFGIGTSISKLSPLLSILKPMTNGVSRLIPPAAQGINQIMQ